MLTQSTLKHVRNDSSGKENDDDEADGGSDNNTNTPKVKDYLKGVTHVYKPV